MREPFCGTCGRGAFGDKFCTACGGHFITPDPVDWEAKYVALRDAVSELADEALVPCSCAGNEYPGFLTDEDWSPEFPGERPSLTERGYLVCPRCDGEGLRSPDQPTRDDIRALLARVEKEAHRG